MYIIYIRGGGTGTASTAVAVPLLWRMRLSRTIIGAILMTSLRLAFALTPAAQDIDTKPVPQGLVSMLRTTNVE